VFEWSDPADPAANRRRLSGRRLIVFWSVVAVFGAVALTIGIIAAVIVTRDRIHDHRVDTIKASYAQQLKTCVRDGTSRPTCSVRVYARCIVDPRWNGDRSTAVTDCAAVRGLTLH
jgi:hypothetical protein